MGIRPKLILVFLVFGFTPLVVLSVVLFRGGVRSIEADLRNGVVRDSNGIAREIDGTLYENEEALAALARSETLREYIRAASETTNQVIGPQKKRDDSNVHEGVTQEAKLSEVQNRIGAFMLSKPTRYTFIYCVSPSGKPLLRAESIAGREYSHAPSLHQSVVFQTKNFLLSNIDPRVWNSSDRTPLLSPISRDANGATLRYSIPIFTGDLGRQAPRGILIAELNADAMFNDVMIGRSDEGRDPSSSQRMIIVLDNERRILHHTNEALRYQPVDSVMPTFNNISRAMIAGEIGSNFYEATNSRWLVAYHPINAIGASVGVAGNYTTAKNNLNRLAWITFILLGIFGLGTVIVFSHVLKNTARSIERVTEGAVAIAGGKLEQRIEVRSNDETRLLAESFNKMTDRLRDQIARETETRQFESFMRLSAMLTHDLKNAIAGLSLLVGNMERQFHREEFREDAMKSLTEAADKLRRLVAKLSEPVLSLSSEHKMARPVDLVVMIKRVITNVVEPASDMLDVETNLPETLFATVEADRLEKVFENLIINAIEAMGVKAGKLTIEAGAMDDSKVFFRVSDTGPGMSDEFQRVKLFRPFATTKKSGIGLGLYTCREIVQAHGGRIDVESKRGSGATFRVVLPSEPKLTGSA